MKLDIESLNAFKQVVEAGGFTAAAERLCLSQSAVSWKVKRLEQRIGWPLLRREGRGIALTEHGQELIEHARRILAAHDAAVRRFQGSELSGTLRLGVTDSIAVQHMGSIAKRFRRAHPGVSLQLRVELPLALERSLASGRLDMAILPLEVDRLRADDHPLWRDELLWLQSREVDFSAEPRLPLVTFGEDCFFRQLAVCGLGEAGIEFELVLECPSLTGVLSAVGAGIGLSLLNGRLLGEELCRWPGAEQLAAPPPIAYVIRAAQQPMGSLQQTLAGQIGEALGE